MVYRAEHIYAKEQVAVKVISKVSGDGSEDDMDFLGEKDCLDSTTRKSIENELRVLEMTTNIHGVIEYYEVSHFKARDSKLMRKSI